MSVGAGGGVPSCLVALEHSLTALSRCLQGEDVVNTLAENNDTFKRRTEFSRAKYLKRKRKKYGRSP